MDVDCSDKVFMVTGANRGIGKSIAAEIARKGKNQEMPYIILIFIVQISEFWPMCKKLMVRSRDGKLCLVQQQLNPNYIKNKLSVLLLRNFK